jgi:hypothetical protein
LRSLAANFLRILAEGVSPTNRADIPWHSAIASQLPRSYQDIKEALVKLLTGVSTETVPFLEGGMWPYRDFKADAAITI